MVNKKRLYEETRLYKRSCQKHLVIQGVQEKKPLLLYRFSKTACPKKHLALKYFQKNSKTVLEVDLHSNFKFLALKLCIAAIYEQNSPNFSPKISPKISFANIDGTVTFLLKVFLGHAVVVTVTHECETVVSYIGLFHTRAKISYLYKMCTTYVQ